MLALPSAGLEALTSQLRRVETSHHWPIQLTQGHVSSLAKNTQPGSVDHFRPITIYSIIYRCWSSLRSRQALKAVARIIPESIKGGLPQRQAKTIWYSLSLQVDFSQANGQALHGVILDIRKAFNALPRFPLWDALLKLGFPPSLLHAWVSFVSQQTRQFKVRSSVGAPIASNCGYPEGCGWSVFAMVLMDWL